MLLEKIDAQESNVVLDQAEVNHLFHWRFNDAVRCKAVTMTGRQERLAGHKQATTHKPWLMIAA